MSDITVPDLDYVRLAPMLIVFGAAVLSVLVEAFAPRNVRYPVQMIVTMTGLVVSFLAVINIARDRTDETIGWVAAAGSVAIDGPGLFLQGTILLLAAVAALAVGERALEPGGPFAAQAAATPGSESERRALLAGVTQTEVFPLFLFAVGGLLLFPVANDLLTLFVALEVLSLPIYLLCGLARRRRLLSQEAALKYFLLGAFSSAFMLYGIALVYGYAGTLSFGPRQAGEGALTPGIPEAISNATGNDVLLLIGVALISVGLLFKISAVPFHVWTPDAYQGAPTAITGFMAACTKVAAFGALLRVLHVAFGGLRWDWSPLVWVVAILTMVAGAILAITQTDVKRMLAYSSIAHAGFLLVGLAATSEDGVSGILFYLVAYGFVTLGAFALLTVVRDSAGEATHLSQWAGMGRRSPLVAGLLALFLLAFAGIPLTSGFIGKFAVFSAAIDADATPLVIVGVVSSAIAAFFYVRVIVLMFFSEPAADGPTVAVPSVLTTVAVALAAAITVALGVAPQPLLDLAQSASGFVR